MNREEVLTCLKSVCAHALEHDRLLLVGSQAVHASLPETELPRAAQLSREVDISYIVPDEGVVNPDFLDSLNAADFFLGEDSVYESVHNFYMEYVPPGTTILPVGWRENLVELQIELVDGSATTISCLGLDELAVSKLLRNSPKDLDFVGELIECDVLDPFMLQGLIQGELEFDEGYLPLIDAMRQRASDFLEQYISGQ